MFAPNFVLNAEGADGVGQTMIQHTGGTGFNPGLLRPYFDRETRQPCVTINTGRFKYNKDTGLDEPIYEQVSVRELRSQGIDLPVFNATTLEKQQWIMLDKLILSAARKRLRAWADLAAASPYGGFNGMQKTILEHQTTNDPGEALVDMDGLSEGRSDRRKYQLEGVPLPITHSSFRYNSRELETSKAQGTPINVRDAEAAARRVAEKVEQTLIGTATGLAFGDATNYGLGTSQVYGYTTYPNRNTTTHTTPTGSNPEVTVNDVLGMKDILTADNHYGPYMVYHGASWDRYMDNDYARLGGNNASMTLRDRLRRIDGVQDVRRLDYLTGYTLLMVEMTSDVAQAVNGMDLTTIQWATVGGMQLHFKVMCIYVPRLFSDFDGRCGICHSTAV